MSTRFSPLQLLNVALAGWMSRHQQAVIDYLVDENPPLKEQLDGRRLQLTDNQRRRSSTVKHGPALMQRSPQRSVN